MKAILFTAAIAATGAVAQPRLTGRPLFTEGLPQALSANGNAALVTSGRNVVVPCSGTPDSQSQTTNYLCWFNQQGDFLRATPSAVETNQLTEMDDGRVAATHLTFREGPNWYTTFGPQQLSVVMTDGRGAKAVHRTPEPDENSDRVGYRGTLALPGSGLLVMTEQGKGYFYDSQARVIQVLNPLANQYNDPQYLAPIRTKSGQVALYSKATKEMLWLDAKGGEVRRLATDVADGTSLTSLPDGQLLLLSEKRYLLLSESGKVLSEADFQAQDRWQADYFRFADGTLALQSWQTIRFLSADGRLVADYAKPKSWGAASRLVADGPDSFVFAFESEGGTQGPLSVYRMGAHGEVVKKILDGKKPEGDLIPDSFIGFQRVANGTYWLPLSHFAYPPSGIDAVVSEAGEVNVVSPTGGDPHATGYNLASSKLMLVNSSYGVHLIRYDGQTVASFWPHGEKPSGNCYYTRYQLTKIDERHYLADVCDLSPYLITVEGN